MFNLSCKNFSCSIPMFVKYAMNPDRHGHDSANCTQYRLDKPWLMVLTPDKHSRKEVNRGLKDTNYKNQNELPQVARYKCYYLLYNPGWKDTTIKCLQEHWCLLLHVQIIFIIITLRKNWIEETLYAMTKYRITKIYIVCNRFIETR